MQNYVLIAPQYAGLMLMGQIRSRELKAADGSDYPLCFISDVPLPGEPLQLAARRILEQKTGIRVPRISPFTKLADWTVCTFRHQENRHYYLYGVHLTSEEFDPNPEPERSEFRMFEWQQLRDFPWNRTLPGTRTETEAPLSAFRADARLRKRV